MELYEWALILASIAAAVWMEIRQRSGLEERIAVLETLVAAIPDVHSLTERVAALEGVRSSAYREPAPEDDKRCGTCGRFRK